MSKISLKDRMAQKMKAKYDESESNRGFISFLKLDDSIKKFSPKKGKHSIDIIPYVVSTTNNPKTEKGGDDYSLEVWVHFGIGVKKGAYVCLEKTYGKKCPICEYIASNNLDEETHNQIKPKQRVLYNVLNHANNEVEVFSVSHPLFEQEWQTLLEDYRESDEIVTPIYDEGGCSIKFTDTGKSGLGRFTGFRFVEITDYDKTILKKAISLDTLLVVPSYDELKKAFEGGNVFSSDEDEDEEEEKPVKKQNSNYNKIEDNDDEDDTEIEQDEDEEEKPVKKMKSHSEDDEDEPIRKPIKKQDFEKSNKCPHGHKFGFDFESFNDCDSCDNYTPCYKKANDEDEE